jgi:hypothetical protein
MKLEIPDFIISTGGVQETETSLYSDIFTVIYKMSCFIYVISIAEFICLY